MKQNKLQDLCETIRKKCDEKGLMDKLDVKITDKCGCCFGCNIKLNASTIKINCYEDMPFKPFYEVMSSVFEDLIVDGYDAGISFGENFYFSKDKTFFGVSYGHELVDLRIKMSNQCGEPKLIPYTDVPKDKENHLLCDDCYEIPPLFLDAQKILAAKAHILKMKAICGGKK